MSQSARRDRQVVRLLSIFLMLLRGARPTVYELAARFRTRRETIYRDLRALGDAGIPIVGDDAGTLSRPRLAEGFRLAVPPPNFTRKEFAAITWALRGQNGTQPFRSALATALPKLQNLAPPQDRLSVAGDGVVGGWTRGVKDYAGCEVVLLRLVEAIASRTRCKVEYQAPGRPAARRFPYDPYRILSVHGGLYVVGKVPAFTNIATLAIDRLRLLELTTTGFTIDPGFDPKQWESEAFGVVWEKPMGVVLRFRADQAPYVREREWHPTQKLRDLRDGRVELTFRAGGMFEIMRWVLGWGDAVEALRPATLRREIAAVLQKAAATYRARRPVGSSKSA